uniref:Arginine vasopressin-induced protein 1 n=1 Tax=Seriola lalandi dorsalis TaxID=1841481 RepID=A0A3B4YXE2_SERLL
MKIKLRSPRKTGCSNIFSGVNLHQLHRLFRTAGDRDAEHRAKLVWRGMDRQVEAGLKIKVHMKMGRKEH